ncbi:MAG: ABC transporter permease [Anaerolineae bacterium]|jgi:peptide/nickel transport system permease protein
METDPKTLEVAAGKIEDQPRTMGRFNKWDTPWLNVKMIAGVAILLALFLSAVIGPRFWDTDLGFARSAPRNLPPVGFENWRGQPGVPEHPLGTDNLGRDLLAVAILGAPTTFIIGALAATLGIIVGIVLGFSAGFLGGWVDDVIRLASDVTLTIPALMVLIVLQSVLDRVEIATMALLIAAFSWPRATRQIRSQVLSMRESGYVQMAQLSGASNFALMFKEMLPNLIPYLFASFIAGATGAILTAVGLETLGLGPTRVSTLGGTIYDAYVGTALSLNMWWWWGLPTVLLSLMFIGLLLVNLGFDEISNPRLRKASR